MYLLLLFLHWFFTINRVRENNGVYSIAEADVSKVQMHVLVLLFFASLVQKWYNQW